METETGFMQPQARKLLEPLEVLEARKGSPSAEELMVLNCGVGEDS